MHNNGISEKYPEINGLGLADIKAAIGIGEVNLIAMDCTPRTQMTDAQASARLDLVSRLNAMYDRMRRLNEVEKTRKRITAALAKNK